MSTTRSAGYGLSAQQRRLLRNTRDTSELPRVTLVVQITELPDDDIAESAVRAAVARHEVLRTAFPAAPGRRYGLQVPQAVRERNLITTAAVDNDAHVGAEAERLAGELPIDLEGRPFGVVVVRGPNQNALGLMALGPVADYRSLGVLLDEILVDMALGPVTRAPAVRYAAYAAWQHEQQDSGRGATAAAGAGLDTEPPDQDIEDLFDAVLPLATHRSAQPVLRRASVHSDRLCGATQHRRDAAEVANVVRAGWTVFLSRWTGADRVLLGTVADGRNLDGLEHAVGPYAAMLPLTTTVDRQATFADFKRTLTRQTGELGAGLHNFDWRRFGERIERRRIPFGFAHVSAHLLPASATLYSANVWPDDFTVAVTVTEGPAGPSVELVHDEQAITADYAAMLARQFGAFLDALIGSPDTPLAEIVLRGDSVVVAASDGIENVPVHERVQSRAREHPDRIAVIDGAETVSFGALVERSERLANRLRRVGVGPGSAVLSLVNRGTHYPVVALAAASLGACFVPLDPSKASARVNDVVADGLASVTVAQQATVRLAPEGLPTLLVDDDNVPAEPARRAEALPENTCYVMYTSGSTGRPKPVAVSVDNLAHYAHALPHALGLRPVDRILHTAPLGFSSSIRQTIVALANGSSVVVAHDDELAEPTRLIRRVITSAVTVLDLVPSLWGRISPIVEQDSRMRAEFRSKLRLLLSASEPLTTTTATSMLALRPATASVINMYGQTETCGIVAMAPVTDHAAPARGVERLGTPIPGTSILILDHGGSPVPVGTSGVIHVAGPQLGAGYPGHEGETAERFRTVQLDGRDIDVYDTGDIGILDIRGDLHYRGRTDGQVKVRGFRVELGEVEAGLAAHPAVRDCAVTVTSLHGSETTQLHAFVVPHRDQRPTHADLVSYLSERIAAYLIPNRFQLVTALPRTDNGKIDRTALTRAATEGKVTSGDFVAPQTEIERTLMSIWIDVLAAGEIGTRDNFFELGGNSLLGIDVITRVMERIGVHVPWTAIFDNPTIVELAGYIDEVRSGAKAGVLA